MKGINRDLVNGTVCYQVVYTDSMYVFIYPFEKKKIT